MLNIVPTFIRKYFARSYNNGEPVDATMLASQDAQNADFSTALNQCRARLNAISTAAGSLRYALVSLNTATATASQTAFTVTTYDSTAGASFVLAFSGASLISPALVTQTSNTVVTVPAQTVGTAVTIAIFGAGNGTSQLASTSAGQGASLIGINDAGSLLVSTEVESALQEIATNLADPSYVAAVISLSEYIRADGATDFSDDQSMGDNKLTDLAAGDADSNDAARMADVPEHDIPAAGGQCDHYRRRGVFRCRDHGPAASNGRWGAIGLRAASHRSDVPERHHQRLGASPSGRKRLRGHRFRNLRLRQVRTVQGGSRWLCRCWQSDAGNNVASRAHRPQFQVVSGDHDWIRPRQVALLH